MQNYIIVFFGAGIGGILRYWLSGFVYKFLPANFPYGTLAINFLGSFIIGFVIFGLYDKELVSQDMRLFLTIGFCGGFTTFSTFSLETFNLFKNSEFLFASLNIFLSVFLCLAGTYLAYIISNR
jgi:fluoride exporter